MEDGVILCNDGKYRWTYEVNLYKNTQTLRDLFLAIGFGLGFLFVLMVIAEITHHADLENMVTMFLVFLGIAAFLSVLAIVSYYIWAVSRGGRYCVLFIMDEQSITHQQMPSEVKKSQVIGAIGTLAGIATGNLTTAGASLLAASASTFRTEFRNVKKIKVVRKRNLIKVNEMLTKNRVYVSDEDYFFVLNFICQHCPQARK